MDDKELIEKVKNNEAVKKYVKEHPEDVKDVAITCVGAVGGSAITVLAGIALWPGLVVGGALGAAVVGVRKIKKKANKK